MSLTPDLDALRLELAAACFDSVTHQFAHFARFGHAEGISDDDAAPFLHQPAVPSDPSAFEASMSRPPPPQLPEQPGCIGSALLDAARERLAEARDTLGRGESQLLRAATQAAALLHTWCGG